MGAFIRWLVETVLDTGAGGSVGTQEQVTAALAPPPAPAPRVNENTYRQLVGIASNLNQIARWTNTHQRAPETTALRHLAGEIEALAQAVRGTGPEPAPGLVIGAQTRAVLAGLLAETQATECRRLAAQAAPTAHPEDQVPPGQSRRRGLFSRLRGPA